MKDCKLKTGKLFSNPMLLRKSMKMICLLIIILFLFKADTTFATAVSPIANAGPDQTIYLTQTYTVTLDGSSSSDGAYLWTEISTDYKSGAIISSPTSAITNVTGLIQGTFYYQLAVTSGGITAKDTVVIRVDYDVPPPNSTLIRQLSFSDILSIVNIRDDTTKYWNYENDLTGIHHQYYDEKADGFIYIERARENDMMIDSAKGKIYSIIEDGYGGEDIGSYGGTYSRTELTFGKGPGIDSNKTYVFEWKGYFPQTLNFLTADQSVFGEALAILQIHPGGTPIFQYSIRAKDSSIKAVDNINGDWSSFNQTSLGHFSTFFNKTHTIRTTIREGKGYEGQKAFLKVEMDGVQKYLRDTGKVGGNFQHDYPKFGSMYDFSRSIVNPDSLSRGRKVALVTEEFRVYQLINNLSTANAGSDQTITLPINIITLSGVGSSLTENIKSYLWSKILGPATGSITNKNAAVTSVTSLTKGAYQFELKVLDDNNNVSRDTMHVTVNPAPNITPVAKAGSAQTITLPLNYLSLSGSGTDNDGTVISYLWTKISGPSDGTISNMNAETTSVTGLIQGTFQFELKVTDNNGAVGRDTMQVIVNPAANIPPVVKAGSDQSITLPVNKTTLAGSGTDADGTIVSYLWTKISGTASFCMVNAASPVTDVTGLIQGTYLIELKATDNKGAVGKDTMQVTVNPAANIPPVANAGSDIMVTFPVNSVNLYGSGTDADGIVVSYLWKQISVPAGSVVKLMNRAVTNINNLVGGTYEMELTITDNEGATGKDTMILSVAFGRMAPLVNSINVYPNPVKDIAILEINTISHFSDLLIIISDQKGNVIYRKNTNVDQTKITEKVNMVAFAHGIYTLTVYFNKKDIQSLKIAKL